VGRAFDLYSVSPKPVTDSSCRFEQDTLPSLRNTRLIAVTDSSVFTKAPCII